MTITRSRFRRLLRLGLFALLVVIVVGYAIWRSMAYVNGPGIEIFQPVDGATVSSTTVEVVGRASRVSSLSLDSYPITMDQNGNFSETLIVFPGVDFITVSATDQFGRSTKKIVEIMGTVALPTAGTTTASSSAH